MNNRRGQKQTRHRVLAATCPELLTAILDKASDSTRRAMPCFSSIPEASLHLALWRIHAYSIFDRNVKLHRAD